MRHPDRAANRPSKAACNSRERKRSSEVSPIASSMIGSTAMRPRDPYNLPDSNHAESALVEANGTLANNFSTRFDFWNLQNCRNFSVWGCLGEAKSTQARAPAQECRSGDN